MSTAAQIRANQHNAQHSTGPRTEAGKAISSKNALATGLTGRTVLLPTDDVPRYEAHVAAYRDQFRPANLYETTLVQSIADTDWRLARIPGLLLALEAALDDALLEDDTDTMARIEKQLRNLQLQESRLHRRRTLDCKELRAVQATRQAEEAAHLDEAAELLTLAEQMGEPFDPAANGFEFSTAQIRAHRSVRSASASISRPVVQSRLES
jgi:hypothetical protein